MRFLYAEGLQIAADIRINEVIDAQEYKSRVSEEETWSIWSLLEEHSDFLVKGEAIRMIAFQESQKERLIIWPYYPRDGMKAFLKIPRQKFHKSSIMDPID